MKKYTLTKLLKKLQEFEENVYKFAVEKGFERELISSKMRIERIKELPNLIVVEMTLEPIYTIDLDDAAESLKSIDDETSFSNKVKEVYLGLAESVEPVSPELSQMLKSLF